MAFEFPSGSTILLPSSLLTHGNTQIGEHETRSSVVQYIPGGLIHWVDYDYQTVESLKTTNPEKAKTLAKEAKQRWVNGLNLFSKFSEWHDDVRAMHAKAK